MRPPAEPGLPASLALGVLVAIAVLSPWPFGSVLPEALRAVAAVALVTAAVALGVGAWQGGVALPKVPLWPLAALAGVGLLQLVPLPDGLHALLAPGSHAVWRPAAPEVAAVLGTLARPVSVDPDSTWRGLALAGGLALLAVLAAPALSKPEHAGRAFATVAAFGFVLSAYAIFARARFGALLYGTIAVPTVTPFGPFVNKNHFAGWVVMASLLVAGLALGLADRVRFRDGDWTKDDHAGSVVLAGVAALAMALAGLASLSRGGALALLAGAACLAAFRLFARRAARRRTALLPSLVLAGVLGSILVALVPPDVHERLRTLSGASFRLDTWRDSLRLAGSSPVLGHGLGAFHDAYPRFKRGHGIVRVEHAENDYLETLAETGAPGLGFAVAGAFLLLAAAGRGVAGGRTTWCVGSGRAPAPRSSRWRCTRRWTSTCAYRRTRRSAPWPPPPPPERRAFGHGPCPAPSPSPSRPALSRCSWPPCPCRTAPGSARARKRCRPTRPPPPPSGASGSSGPTRRSEAFSAGAPRRRSRG